MPEKWALVFYEAHFIRYLIKLSFRYRTFFFAFKIICKEKFRYDGQGIFTPIINRVQVRIISLSNDAQRQHLDLTDPLQ